MTTETNSVLNTVKEAFAPVTEAFTKLQNMEVPEAARDFVKKQAETAKVRAADIHAGSEKVTAAIETAAPPVTAAYAPAPAAEVPPINGLSISSQSWRRGGLGSKALVTFTLRNNNDYAVKDIELVCAFARQDGSHLTDRKRVIPDTVNMKSRKTFARVLVGFVNVSASRAKCTPVAANRS